MLHSIATSPAVPAPSLERLKTLIAADLHKTNQLIQAEVASEIPLIAALSGHIIAAGGKRIRPSLTLASALLCGYSGDRHIRLAACVEFIHTATLLHDDVVDKSELRRGEATANALWGNQASVLVGDFLLSRAFQLMVADGSMQVLRVLSDAAAIISAGEVKQLAISHDMAVQKQDYLDVLHAKTAILFASACELGAIVANKPGYQQPLRRFGEALGMAFQLIDDALDYTGTAEALGKSIGDDFRDGKVTLPMMLAYQRGTAEEKAFWQRCVEGEEEISDADLAHAQKLIAAHNTVADSLLEAQAYGDIARTAIAELPESAAKEAMLETLAFCLARSY
jgi:octaprenyl-diphosphate synthase